MNKMIDGFFTAVNPQTFGFLAGVFVVTIAIWLVLLIFAMLMDYIDKKRRQGR